MFPAAFLSLGAPFLGHSLLRQDHPMAQKLDDKELVHPHELMMSNVIQLDAVTQLLIEKDIITEEEFFTKLKLVQAEYERRRAAR